MAKDITSPHLWKLTDVGQVKAAGDKVVVRRIVYAPAVAADDLVLQEYAADGSTLKDFCILKAGAADVDWVTIDYGPDGEGFNGLYVGTIDGGTVYIYIKGVVPKITA